MAKSMQEEEYTFVTLDSTDAMPADAVLVDVDNGEMELSAAIWVDDTDFITLADDTEMLSDVDTLDMTDTDMFDADITFLV